MTCERREKRGALTVARARALARRFEGQRVLVIGDVMLDEFVWGKVSRISPEAPVPVVCVQREEWYPGGAANAARSLRALGASVSLMGRIGADGAGQKLRTALRREGIDGALLMRGRCPTVVKTRVIARSQHVVRVDREVASSSCRGPALRRVRAALEEAIAASDAVVVEDYGKGFVTQELVDAVGETCGRLGRPWTADPNPGNPLRWGGALAVKPNRGEAFAAAGLPATDRRDDLETVAALLFDRWKAQWLLITLGEEGMALFGRDGQSGWIAARAREVYDVTGAGDTAIAAFTLAAAAGATVWEAAELANAAAGVVVAKVGTAAATVPEVLAQLG